MRESTCLTLLTGLVVLLLVTNPVRLSWGQVTDALSGNALANAQDPEMGEMELMEHVAELQRQLESSQVAERDEAEKQLLQLGTRVLDHLEPLTDDASTDATQRLLRVRLTLEKIAVAAVTEASKVAISGSMTVADVLADIRRQTQNDVALDDRVPDLFGEQIVKLDFEDVEFWEALNELMKQGGLEIDAYAGQPGQLRLVPTPAARVAAANPELGQGDEPAKVETTKLPRNISGVFDLTVTKINSSRNLVNPKLNYCNITIQVRWEPRVQPISIDLPISSIKAIDEFDTPVPVGNEQAVMSGIVQPEIPELEFSIPIGLVDRQIEVIQSFEATIDAVLPGRVETFRFKKIGKLSDGSEQRKAGAIVTFGGIRKNDDLHGVTVRLSFEDEHNALESHQGWAFNNPMYLEDRDGEKFQPIAYETLRQDNEQIAIQYYFQEDPSDMNLVYKTPAAIVEVPVKIQLKNIPLP